MTSPTPSETSLSPLSRNGRDGLARPKTPLVMLAEPRSPAAEAYRALATSLEFANLATVAITSAAANEGKTSVVGNLAVALAEAGRRVIVVDADLRQPGLHALFGLGTSQDGLTSLVGHDLAQPEPHLPLQDTGVAGIRLLASGPPTSTPLEVLASRRVDQALAQARSQSDIVLVDTPPAAGLADAAVLAPRVDGVILVVSAGRTRRDLARRAKAALERVNANLLGVVLTNVRGDDRLYRY